MRPLSLLTLSITALSIAACTTTSERAADIDRVIQTELEAALRAPPPAEQTRDLLMPPLVSELPELAAERFHITVEQAPARQVLLSLVADTDLNMVVHPEVDALISLELRNVTVLDVLEIMQDIYGLEFERTRTGYTVRPPRLSNRIYEVNYLDLNREGVSRTRISSGQATENPAALQDDLGGFGGARGGAALGDPDQATGTRIETTSQTNFWEGLEDAIRAILKDEPDRNVMVNRLSGVIAVRAMPHEHRAIAELIEAIQSSVQRQVILEAKIIEVELRDGFQSGINWTALREIDGRLFGMGQVAGPGIFEQGISALGGRDFNVRPGEIFQGFESRAFGGASVITADSRDFNTFIELLETQGHTRVLSSPRVATINNQRALIKVGTDEFFATGVTGRTAAGVGGVTAVNSVQLAPFFSGIALDVTPQISRNGEVILHIHPTVSEVTDQTKSFTVAGQEETLPLAFSSVRQTDSFVRARNGQVVVIGGLMRESTTQRRFGTPGLSRIPVLGHAFGSRQEVSVKTELVILLRPTVVEDDESWQRSAADSLERLRDLSQSPWPR